MLTAGSEGRSLAVGIGWQIYFGLDLAGSAELLPELLTELLAEPQSMEEVECKAERWSQKETY